MRDPSCPYFVISSENLKKIINTPAIGTLKQGFWWEFYYRAKFIGIDIVEVPINHRIRKSGKTVVYKFNKVPKIAFEHIVGLFKLKKILNENIQR